MLKMHAIIYQVSMYVIDILLFYIINQLKQPKNLISKKRKNLLRKQNKDLVSINLIITHFTKTDKNYAYFFYLNLF